MSKMFAKDITNKNMTACLSILMMCIFVLSACNVNNKKGVKIKGSDSLMYFVMSPQMQFIIGSQR